MTLYSIPEQVKAGGSGTATPYDIIRPFLAPPEVVDHTAQWEPLGSRYVVYLLAAEPERKTASGIILAGKRRQEPSEAIVLAVGPGKRRDDGEREPMQAKAGDRILLERYPDGALRGFQPLPGQMREGIVSDEDLCAIIPGPRYDEVRAAGDYVLVEPDQRPDVIEHASGVLQATYLLAGGEERETKNRGEEWDGVTIGSAELPRRGKVLSRGPGFANARGERWLFKTLRFTDEDGYPEWLWEGHTVHWERQYEAIRFHAAGQPRALISASMLIAVECE